MTDQGQYLHIQLDPQAIYLHIHVPIRELMAYTFFGSHAAVRLDEFPNYHVASTINLTAESLQDVTADEVRPGFQAWLLRCAFRDAIEALHSSLEVSLQQLHWTKFLDSETGEIPSEMSISEVKHEYAQILEGYNKKNFPEKLNTLEQMNPNVSPGMRAEVESINKARNCLVHRRGIVSKRDTNEGDSLVVRWLGFSTFKEDKEGDVTPLSLPVAIEGGEKLIAKQSKLSKQFNVGDSLSFSPDEVSGIFLTLDSFGAVLSHNVGIALEEAGFEVIERPSREASREVGEAEEDKEFVADSDKMGFWEALGKFIRRSLTRNK